ncbi:type 1 glutamine amidotransferase [Cytophaga hutchinsonii]|nr:type 1 glutamine amidotransferase [Cytophaga hutchinsonii]
MEDWVRRPSNKVTATRFYEDERMPFVELFDTLIVMGGPMSVHDEKKYPWLVQEKQLIKKAIERGKKVIGICLGAQLIAEVLGATVSKNTYREIGWMPVTKTTAAKTVGLFSDLPDTMNVFHWHGETFNMPEGATHLLSSEACVNQAFLYGDNVLALQFHMEMTHDAIKLISEYCQDELIEGPYIHKEDTFYNDDNTVKANQWMYQLLNKFTQS